MPDAYFAFRTQGFADTPEDLRDHVNGIGGRALAVWLSGELKAAGLNASPVFAEDHGWDFSVGLGGAKYMCACSIERENADDAETELEAHVALTKVRSLPDRMFGRNRFEANDAVAAAIGKTLAASVDVIDLEKE